MSQTDKIIKQTDKIIKQKEQLDKLVQPFTIFPLEGAKEFYRKAPKITYNTYQKNIKYARMAFLDLIAPDGDITKGIYSKAYENSKKKIHIDNFVQNLKKDDYNVYDWKTIYDDLWSKDIDENDYESTTYKGGILVTDGKRQIKVKNYNNQFYSLPEGGLNKGETPKQTALREFNEETQIYIKDYEDKLKEKCVCTYTLRLSSEEYDDFIKRFNPSKFMKYTTPEVSGINLEFGKDIEEKKHPLYKQKYLKYKQKYLELKKLLIK
jgi:8-oxo-dGTP pyrophosphatase MutT (NUDIX family)